MSSILRLPWQLIKLTGYLRRNQIQTIFVSMFHFWAPALWVLSRLLGKHLIFMVHDAERRAGMSRIEIYFNEFMIRKSDSLVVLSRSVARTILNMGVAEERIIHSVHGYLVTSESEQHSLISRKARKLKRADNLRLLFFGRILPYKGLDLLLNAFQNCLQSTPQIELHIFGSGSLPDNADLIVCTRQITLHNRWINDAEIPEIMNSADLLVLPYRQASQSGVVALAAFYGLPLICTDVGSLAEQVRHNKTGLVIPYTDDVTCSKALEQAILKFAKQPALVEKFSKASLQLARHELSWEKIAAKLWQDIQTKLKSI